MKNLILLAFVSTISFGTAQIPDNAVVIGKIDTIYSKILNEKQKIFVYVPDGYNPIYSKVNYPVIYLLDGDVHFHSVTGMIQQLSQVNGNTVLPEMIVVGVTNNDRSRDLSPTHINSDPFMDSAMLAVTGGGELFTNYIEKELIPYINSAYPTAPYRVLIGHSLGGLMVMNTLLKHTNLFNAYISIDPSIWWDNQFLLKQANKDLTEIKYNGKKLYMAMANEMKSGMDTSRLRNDTAFYNLHSKSILQFSDAINKNTGNGLEWNWKFYEDENHGSLPLIAEYDALKYIFSFHKFPMPATPEEFKIFNFDSAFVTHYKNISKEMGYTVKPPESLINILGYQLLQLKNFENALKLFALNIASYPNSLNVYDSMGDCYHSKGDKSKAIEYYTLALKHGDSPETQSKLQKLKEEK